MYKIRREEDEEEQRGVESGIQAQAPRQHIERGRKELPISSRRFTRLSTSATDVALNSELSIAASSFSKTQVTRGQTVSSRLMRSPNDQTFSPSWRLSKKPKPRSKKRWRSAKIPVRVLIPKQMINPPEQTKEQNKWKWSVSVWSWQNEAVDGQVGGWGRGGEEVQGLHMKKGR